MSGKGKLKGREEAFVRELLKDGNKTQAWIRAGGKPDNADVVGPRQLRKVRVRKAYEAALAKLSDKAGITAQAVLEEIRAIGFAPVELKFGESGGPIVPLRYEHKLKALELLGKHLTLFTEKHEHSGPQGEPLQIVVQKYSDTDEEPE